MSQANTDISDTGQRQQIIGLLARMADGQPIEAKDAPLIKALCETAPSSSLGWLLALICPEYLDAVEEEECRARLFLGTSSASTLNYAFHGKEWSDFYPAPLPEPGMKTEEVIDSFLSHYGHSTPAEEALLEKMIFNPTPDYAEMLAREESENLPPTPMEKDSQDALIASFILSHHPATVTPEPVPDTAEAAGTDNETQSPVSRPEPEADSLPSESLAAIFIRQGRFEKAYDIISSLSLKFPKKSAYFADQLRFLRKLIINRRHTDGKST